MPLLKEFRILLPMTLEEFQIGQLYTVAEASKGVTGGGDGIEVIKNEPYTREVKNSEGEMVQESGHYTYKKYHIEGKIPRFVRALLPAGAMEFEEVAYNAYPRCSTLYSNPRYMKDGFELRVDTIHIQDDGSQENVHNLTPEQLAKREVVYIDIANDSISSWDYKEEEDPTKFRSEKAGRGPLGKGWRDSQKPLMCAYKLAYFKFKWWGLQGQIEKIFMNQEKRLLTILHRQLFCWLDRYYDMTMDDIRALEAQTKEDLEKERSKGEVKGFSASEAKK